MKEKKEVEYLLETIIVFVVTLLIIISFLVYMNNNVQRITKQNKTYLEDLTKVTAYNINETFKDYQGFLKTSSYLFVNSLNEDKSNISTLLKEFEDNDIFDNVRFVDENGIDYTSNDEMIDISSREYFQDGINGNSGITPVYKSKVTGENQLGFYIPLYKDNNIIGLLVGFLNNETLLNEVRCKMFDYTCESWIITPDGKVLATNVTFDKDVDVIGSVFSEYINTFDSEIADDINKFLVSEENLLTFQTNHSLGKEYSCIAKVRDYGWSIVLTFPVEAHNEMLHTSNKSTIIFLSALLIIFVSYALYLVIKVIFKLRKEQIHNKNANDISNGVSLLFERFVVVDFSTDKYEYIYGTPSRSDLEMVGNYEHLCEVMVSNIQDEKEKLEASLSISKFNVIKCLEMESTVSFVLKSPDDDSYSRYNYILLSKNKFGQMRVLLTKQKQISKSSKQIKK